MGEVEVQTSVAGAALRSHVEAVGARPLAAAAGRRIVTGVDRDGRSCIASEDAIGGLGGDRPAGPLGPIVRHVAEAATTQIRMLDIPPEGGTAATHEAVMARMHSTPTVDHAFVLEGELVLILDVAETVARPGDMVVQRGTRHAWTNRGTGVCRAVFVIDAAPDAPMRQGGGK